jgi:ketosteroid isomerase-like protein
MKRNPYRYAFGAMFVALVVACSPAPAVEAGDPAAAKAAALEAALQADRDFAALAAKDGPKAAFETYLDPVDGEFIAPGAVSKGMEQVVAGFAQSPPGFAIEWAPDGGHGSASGDLAVTTGRYTIRIEANAIEQGRYVTVWRKNADGALKAVMDLGVADPPPQSSPTPTPQNPDLQGRPG